MTPLHWAAFHCRDSHVKLLIERGIDVRLQDIDGKTALHWAAQVRHRYSIYIVRVLHTLQYSVVIVNNHIQGTCVYKVNNCTPSASLHQMYLLPTPDLFTPYTRCV